MTNMTAPTIDPSERRKLLGFTAFGVLLLAGSIIAVLVS